MGICRLVAFSRSRMQAVAWNPPISGIWTSIKIKSNCCDSHNESASRPLDATVTEWPLLKHANNKFLVDRIVLRQQNAPLTAGLDKWLRVRLPRGLACDQVQGPLNRLEQLRLGNRLGNDGNDPKLSTPSDIGPAM